MVSSQLHIQVRMNIAKAGIEIPVGYEIMNEAGEISVEAEGR